VGALPLVDAYHAFNVLPPQWGSARDRVFAVAGGYKYAAFGEGLCFLRFPRDTTLRPAYTISSRQTALLCDAITAAAPELELVGPREAARRGGFVALRVADASSVARALRQEDVWVDARGDVLRLGPAPYLTDAELSRGAAAVAAAARQTR
jgi:selenocysteine lyase/cysteine desulfurase